MQEEQEGGSHVGGSGHVRGGVQASHRAQLQNFMDFTNICMKIGQKYRMRKFLMVVKFGFIICSM